MKKIVPDAPIVYVAALCHMRDGELMDFDSIQFAAPNEAEAKRIAIEWTKTVLGVLTEKTWLQIMRYDAYCLHSVICGEP